MRESENVTFDRFALGDLLRTTAGSFFAGEVYEMAIYTRAIDDTEAGDLSTYLTGAFVAAAAAASTSMMMGV